MNTCQTCETCQFWDPDLYRPHPQPNLTDPAEATHGSCTSGKILPVYNPHHPEELLKTDSVLVDSGYDYSEASAHVGRYFGCIHHQPRTT